MVIRQRRFTLVLFCAVALIGRLTLADAYDPPDGYYNGTSGLVDAALKGQLNAIIDGHTTRTYDQLRADLQVTDVDPNDSSRIMTIYNNRVSVAKVTNGSIPGWDGSPSGPWNREHSWAQSRGLEDTSDPDDNTGTLAPDGSDMHHLFPAIPLANSTRNNFNYGGAFGAQGAGLLTTDGGTKYYPGNLDAGMVARADFYMATRYDGTETHTHDLELAAGNPAENGTTMGDLNRLIEWHYAAVPDTFERNRNQVIYDTYQHNRNPFIDRPEYVWSIFKNQTNDSQVSIAGATVNSNGSSSRIVDLGRIFVNGVVPAPQALTLNKAGANGTYFEVTTGGSAASSLTGRFNAMRTNQTDTKAIDVGLNASTSTSAAGLKSGTVTVDNLDITTAGGTGRGANDANDTFSVSLKVLDHATPSFTWPTLSTVLSPSLNFGNFALGDPTLSLNFKVYNLLATPGFTADMDFDTFSGAGNTSAFSTNLAVSAGSLVLAGDTFHTFTAMLTATTVGTFSATYTLNFSDENIAGALSKSIMLTLTGKTRLAGDYNGDLVVNAADYSVWRNRFGQSVAAYSSADGDGNGTINNLDFNVWRSHFGQTATGTGSGVGLTTAVPEPTSALLLLIAAAPWLCRRSRFLVIG